MAKPEFDDPIIEKMWDDSLETASAAGLSGEELDHMVHTLLARRIVERLQDPAVTPGWGQIALRFCKDNDITGLATPGSASQALRDKMAERLPFSPRITGTE